MRERVSTPPPGRVLRSTCSRFCPPADRLATLPADARRRSLAAEMPDRAVDRLMDMGRLRTAGVMPELSAGRRQTLEKNLFHPVTLRRNRDRQARPKEKTRQRRVFGR